MARARKSGEASFTVYADHFSPADSKALKAAIARVGPAARRQVRKDMKVAGTIVKEAIDPLTPVYGGRKRTSTVEVTIRGAGGASKTYKGRHTPGMLKKSNRIKMGRLSVAVYNSAKAVSRAYPGGYRYGKRLEFDPAFGYNGSTGSSRYAFFYPGWERAKDAAKFVFNHVLKAAQRAYMQN